MKTPSIQIGNVELPLADYCVARTGILGITRSGKTFGAKGIAEQLLDASIPIIVFDAIGVWHHLKTPGDGASAKGYPIVIAGGEHADLPLSPHSAPEIVRAAMRENVSLVIDLYDAKLSKADWRRIVQACFRTLLYENKSVRHIFLEEAAEYAPQKIMDGETYAEVEKLVRMGGNKGLGITLINQRAQELNKAVLELCDNLVLLRQRGSHAIDALEKWLDRVSPDMAKQIAESLPHMTQGDAWVWTEGSERPMRTRTLPIRSFHPDRRTTGNVEAKRAAVDAGKFVSRVAGELSKVIEEAKANDPAALKRQVADLQRQLNLQRHASATPAAVTVRVEEKRVEVPALKPEQVSAMEAAAEKLRIVSVEAAGSADTIRQALQAFQRQIAVPVPRTASVASPPTRAPVLMGSASSENLSKAERKILTVLAQYGACAKNKIARIAGYAVTGGGFNNALSKCRTSGWVTQEDPISITDAGVAALGKWSPLPTGPALVDYWLTQVSKAERLILETLRANPGGLAKATLAEATGYEASGGGFNNALSHLRTIELIEGKETIRLVPELV